MSDGQLAVVALVLAGLAVVVAGLAAAAAARLGRRVRRHERATSHLGLGDPGRRRVRTVPPVPPAAPRRRGGAA
jgi:HAMP domain-containing protein